MAQSDLSAEDAPPAKSEADIVLASLDNPDGGFVGVVPEGWQEITPGIFAGPESNNVGMMQFALPLASTDQVLGMIQFQMGLPNRPASKGTLEANGLTWELFEAEGLGLSLNVALAELDGVTYAVILQDPAEEGSPYYSQVFLRAVDALIPRP